MLAGALLLLVMNFIGLGLGPTYVGAASDYFRRAASPHSLQMALYTLTPFYLIAIAALPLARAHLRRAGGGRMIAVARSSRSPPPASLSRRP